MASHSARASHDPSYVSDYSDAPIPPQHRHLHPSAQPGSYFNRAQPNRQHSVTSPQDYYDRQANRSLSPGFTRTPVSGAQSAPSREISPSPPMHPGMGPMPPQHDGWRNDRGYGDDRGYDEQQNQHYDVYQPHGNSYGPVPINNGGYANVQSAAHQPFSPPGNMGLYGHAAGYATPPPEPYTPVRDNGGRHSPFVAYRQAVHSQASYNSQDALTSAASAPGMAPPQASYGNGHGQYYDRSPSPSRFPQNQHPYSDSPAQSHTLAREHLDGMVFVDPYNLADDADDGLGPRNDSKRASRISFGKMSKNGSSTNVQAGPSSAMAGGAAGAGLLQKSNPNGAYSSVPGGAANQMEIAEKTAWMKDEEETSRAWKKWLFIGLGIFMLLAIAGGTVGGILATRKSSGSGGSSSSQTDGESGNEGDLNINSPAIKALMNNPNLHKVFPGMAYSPINTQYPGCLTSAPIQNNVTLDMAILSQITNTVRLYGTDCNQTQMVLHAIDRLQLTDMKIWLGVWLGPNITTNDRQLEQMYEIIDQYTTKNIKGFVIGNEVLFRKDLPLAQLSAAMSGVKANLTAKGINLPIATSDLGSDWSGPLVDVTDVVMANVHPFFGGVAVAQAADWTWNFWQENDVYLTRGLTGKSNIISEVGWPSEGGNDCSPSPTCPSATAGAVAGLPQMQQFMDTFICATLANGTDYFWFEAFDEPWKIHYDTPTQGWEDHWGLFDVNRNLKPGITIPSCGGKTVSS